VTALDTVSSQSIRNSLHGKNWIIGGGEAGSSEIDREWWIKKESKGSPPGDVGLGVFENGTCEQAKGRSEAQARNLAPSRCDDVPITFLTVEISSTVR
jgi:hypothetical protein